jgi:hypothetical protein
MRPLMGVTMNKPILYPAAVAAVSAAVALALAGCDYQPAPAPSGPPAPAGPPSSQDTGPVQHS